MTSYYFIKFFMLIYEKLLIYFLMEGKLGQDFQKIFFLKQEADTAQP